MITQAERRFIWEYAYVPEHVPEYVSAISASEPRLMGDFLVYEKEDEIILVGYPLKNQDSDKKLQKVLDRITSRSKWHRVSITAPHLPKDIAGVLQAPDMYYRIELESLTVSQKLRNSLRRASRDVEVMQSKAVTREQTTLIEQFVSSHTIDEGTRYIFERIPDYVAHCESARVLEARNAKGDIIAFDVAEYGSKEYAFYLFNFRSPVAHVPGTSDLLLSRIISDARAMGKKYVNLGLGISEGVTFFKTKWGAVPFLSHVTCVRSAETKSSIQTLLERL